MDASEPLGKRLREESGECQEVRGEQRGRKLKGQRTREGINGQRSGGRVSGERCDPIFTPLLLGEPHSPLLSIIMTPSPSPPPAPNPSQNAKPTFFSFFFPFPSSPHFCSNSNNILCGCPPLIGQLSRATTQPPALLPALPL